LFAGSGVSVYDHPFVPGGRAVHDPEFPGYFWVELEVSWGFQCVGLGAYDLNLHLVEIVTLGS
jgi:hypothetical protein